MCGLSFVQVHFEYMFRSGIVISVIGFQPLLVLQVVYYSSISFTPNKYVTLR